jgi:hypothetical protein
MKNLTLNEMITLVSQNIENKKEINLTGALYTEENILFMLKSIKQTPALPDNWKNDIAVAIETMIEEELSSEFVDYDDCEFYLNGNELSVECVGVNTRNVRRACEQLVDDKITYILTSEDEQENEEVTNEENNNENEVD